MDLRNRFIKDSYGIGVQCHAQGKEHMVSCNGVIAAEIMTQSLLTVMVLTEVLNTLNYFAIQAK